MTLTRIDGKLVPFKRRHNPVNNAVLEWMKNYKPAHALRRRCARPARPKRAIRKARAISQHTVVLTLRKVSRRMKSAMAKATRRKTGQGAKHKYGPIMRAHRKRTRSWRR